MKIDRNKFLSLCMSMIPAVAIACGGGGDGTAAGGSDLSASGGATTPGPTKAAEAGAPGAPDVVTVNTKPVSVKTDSCTVDIKAPVVSIPTNPAAEKAINAVLAPLAGGADPCAEGLADQTTAFEVTANANGLLSIVITGDSFFQGAAHPNAGASTFNFDVKNGGKQLKWEDMVASDGATKAMQACLTQSPDAEGAGGAVPAPSAEGVGLPTTEGSPAQFDCQSSLTPDPKDNLDVDWAAKPNGLEIVIETNHAAGDFFLITVPWKDLVTSGLKPNTVLLDFAKAQKQ